MLKWGRTGNTHVIRIDGVTSRTRSFLDSLLHNSAGAVLVSVVIVLAATTKPKKGRMVRMRIVKFTHVLSTFCYVKCRDSMTLYRALNVCANKPIPQDLLLCDNEKHCWNMTKRQRTRSDPYNLLQVLKSPDRETSMQVSELELWKNRAWGKLQEAGFNRIPVSWASARYS